MERIIDLVSESLEARGKTDEPRLSITTGRETSFACSIVLPVDDCPPQALLVTLASIAEKTAGELFEVIIVDCSTRQETKDLLVALGGDVENHSRRATVELRKRLQSRRGRSAREISRFLKTGFGG